MHLNNLSIPVKLAPGVPNSLDRLGWLFSIFFAEILYMSYTGLINIFPNKKLKKIDSSGDLRSGCKTTISLRKLR